MSAHVGTDLLSKNDAIVDLKLHRSVWSNFVRLSLTEHPLAREIEASLTQLIIRGFSVRELSLDAACREVMEQTSVQDADADTIHSNVASQQHIPAVVHHSKATLAHCVA